MVAKPALDLDRGVGAALGSIAHDILAEGRAALDDASRNDAASVHDYRREMKRWRAFLRLVEPFVADGRLLRSEARDLARELAGARDVQAALDALADLAEADPPLAPASLTAMRRRLEAIKRTAEITALTAAMRGRLRAALAAAARAVELWALDDLGFADLAGELARGYRRARRRIPPEWPLAGTDELHLLRQRVIVHRYQMELVQPLWPRLGKVWVGEAQRLRERLGSHHDLVVLAGLTAPGRPLSRWRARLVPLIGERKAAHVAKAKHLAECLFAEQPKAFRRRLEALWESRHPPDH